MMDAPNNDIDAGFFQLVHQLARSPRSEAEENRALVRRQFESFQRIAPWDGQRFPHQSEFFIVRCMDLTRRGFSFLSPREPAFDHLVASLTCPAQAVYLVAEVVRVEPVTVPPDGGVPRPAGGAGAADDSPSRRMFLVGCRFTQRLHRPDCCD